MVLSLSTQGYQSILLSVSMHQNEPVKQSDMLSFSFSPFSSSLSVSRWLNPPFPICFFFYLSSDSLPLCLWLPPSFSVLTFPLPQRLFLPSSLHYIVSETSTWIQFKSYPEKREQQQDFVNGNLIHGEQGVYNAVHVPGSCLIAFGFVRIWLLLTCRERKNYTGRGSCLIFHNVL